VGGREIRSEGETKQWPKGHVTIAEWLSGVAKH
jgi:hypothetical protein